MEHFKTWNKCFKKLQSAGLKFKASKCTLFKKEV